MYNAVNAPIVLEELTTIPSITHEPTETGMVVDIIAKSTTLTVSFFYEMCSRWLDWRGKVHVEEFFGKEFLYHGVRLIRLRIKLSSETATVHSLIAAFERLKPELLFGCESRFRMQQVLESKGMLRDEKLRILQGRLLDYIARFPKSFDYDLLPFFQQILLRSGEQWLQNRTISYFLRIVFSAYLLRKKSQEMFAFHQVLGILSTPLGDRLISTFIIQVRIEEGARFTKEHAIQALQYACHSEVLCAIEFDGESESEKYILVELEVGKKIPYKEKGGIYGEMKRRVERRLLPLFKPRNEEELMKHLVALSRQLRLVSDLPQVMILFEGHTVSELEFSVLIARVLKKESRGIREVVQGCPEITIDKVKKLGLIRKKYLKEASILRMRLASIQFIREDQTIGYLQARETVGEYIKQLLGEVRDCNGGMLQKVGEVLNLVKKEFQIFQEGDLLENMLHSLYPIELRTTLHTTLLGTLFMLFSELYHSEKNEIFCCVKGSKVSLWKGSEEEKSMKSSAESIRFRISSEQFEYTGIIEKEVG